jgi:hypothetical protein
VRELVWCWTCVLLPPPPPRVWCHRRGHLVVRDCQPQLTTFFGASERGAHPEPCYGSCYDLYAWSFFPFVARRSWRPIFLFGSFSHVISLPFLFPSRPAADKELVLLPCGFRGRQSRRNKFSLVCRLIGKFLFRPPGGKSTE